MSHGDELGYIFYRSFLNQTTAPENSTDKKTLNKMVKMWTNFAKTGLVDSNYKYVYTISNKNYELENPIYYCQLESRTNYRDIINNI